LGLGLIAKLFGNSEEFWGALFLSYPSELEAEMPKMAAGLRQYGADILRGDPESWRRVDEWRDQHP
jgi:hypothetical protein